jgi:hypothetical protein
MSLQQEDSIMPLALPPPRSMRVLKSRERSTRRDSISPLHNQTSANSSSLGLLLGALCALVLLALPLPLLLDGSVSIGPRAGLLAMFFVPPAIFMAIVQLRYGESKTD